MDGETIKLHAQAHADAVVAGDLNKAGSDLTPDAQKQAPGVMGELPRPVSSAEVQSVSEEGDAFVARILYSGEDESATVDSRWAERDGRPMILSLTVV